MCSPATCRLCGKVTYSGCGNHVAQVLAAVRHPAMHVPVTLA